MSLKDRMKKRQQTHEKGYISFTEEDIKQAQLNNQANEEAYILLDAAMRTSSHLTERDKNGDSVTIDDIYPCTEAECDEMDSILDNAEKAVKDRDDSSFRERYNELRSITAWSRRKHWTFKWSLIGGCLLSVFGMLYLYTDAEDDSARTERKFAMVENWEPRDTTIAYDACPAEYAMESLDTTASVHKATRLSNIKHLAEANKESVAEFKAKLDTCTSSEQKKFFKKYLKSAEKSQKEYEEQYKDVNDMDFKAYQKMILKEQKASVSAANEHAFWMWFFLIYVVILLPAYIYYSHQYGYYITRHRLENQALDSIQKTGFSIASFFLGTGLAMSLLPDVEVTTHYSDGSSDKHTESDSFNWVIIAIKACLIFIGLCIFALVSVFIMSYVTVMAIKRNYDWQKVAAAANQMSQKAMDKVKESGVIEKVQESAIVNKATEAARSAVDKATEVAKETAGKVQQKVQEKTKKDNQ